MHLHPQRSFFSQIAHRLPGAWILIDPTDQKMVEGQSTHDAIKYPYDRADLNEITLTWAITIHKSQGSEYPVVILPMYMQHYLMLSRNLLYTGLTQAKKLAILVGPKKAIGLAVR